MTIKTLTLSLFLFLTILLYVWPWFYQKSPTLQQDNSRIVGGDIVEDRTNFPYIVSIRYDGNHSCGGSIITDTHVLTAAHCLIDKDKGSKDTCKLTVEAGHLKLEENDGKTFPVKKFTVHPQYNSIYDGDDVAIITICGSFLEYTDKIAPIPIANRDVPSAGTNCTIAGWGKTSNHTENSDKILKSATVSIQNFSQCNASYSVTLIPDKVFCAGNGEADSCKGDSGGPLVCNGNLQGLVSFGNYCASPQYPGVYTDVFKYTDWIVQHSDGKIAKSTALYVRITALFAELLGTPLLFLFDWVCLIFDW